MEQIASEVSAKIKLGTGPICSGFGKCCDIRTSSWACRVRDVRTRIRATKEQPPEGGPPKAFQLPPTEDFTLANGMKVTLVPYGVVPRVAIRAYPYEHLTASN